MLDSDWWPTKIGFVLNLGFSQCVKIGYGFGIGIVNVLR